MYKESIKATCKIYRDANRALINAKSQALRDAKKIK